MKHIIVTLLLTVGMSAYAGAAIVDINVSNATSAAATISWITDDEATGLVHYSTHPALSNYLTAYDARGEAFEGYTHYVEITGLNKETTYYFEVISGGEVGDNNGNYYTLRTMKEALYTPCTLYGFVKHSNDTPAVDAIVYLRLIHAGVESYYLSKLIPSNGSFLFDMKAARSKNTNTVFSSIDHGDPIFLRAVYDTHDEVSLNLACEGCAKTCGTLILASSPASTTSITPTTAPTTIPAPTTVPVEPSTTSTASLGPKTTTTTTIPLLPTTTTARSTTTTLIPLPACEVTINPLTANVLPRETVTFTASTRCEGKLVEGVYRWYVDSTQGSAIDENGLYSAGSVTETVTITVMDTAHGDASATAVVTVSALWPMAYEEMWGAERDAKLHLLRSFRDEVLAGNEVGREYIEMLYSNSFEILILLLQYPSLVQETKIVIDEIVPGICSVLNGDELVLAEKQAADVESLLDHYAIKASPALSIAIERVKSSIGKGGALLEPRTAKRRIQQQGLLKHRTN